MQLKEKIIHEALRQFSAKGFLNTSTMDIIQAVGTSKGGLYNHFKSKEHLYFEALSQARKMWRERNLNGVEQISRPVDKLKQILNNYKDLYLPDTHNLPGGCIFVNLAVELSNQRPHLAQAVNEGFVRFKSMIKRLLDQAKSDGDLLPGVESARVAEMIFAGLLGACVVYSSDKSRENLDRTIGALIDHLSLICK